MAAAITSLFSLISITFPWVLAMLGIQKRSERIRNYGDNDCVFSLDPPLHSSPVYLVSHFLSLPKTKQTMGNPLDLYIIRSAVEADMSQVLEIYNERIANSTCLFMYDEVPLENRLTWFSETKSKGYPIIVAAEKDTNKAVAYASYGGFRPHTAFIL